MVQAKLDVNMSSFLAQVQAMIRNGEIELRNEKEKVTHKIARVRLVDGRGIQVIVGHLYSRPFIPSSDMSKRDLIEAILFDFHELSARVDDLK